MKPTKYTVILLASLAGATHLMAIPDSPAILLPGISHLAGWSDFTVAKTAPDELMAGFSGVANTANTGYSGGMNTILASHFMREAAFLLGKLPKFGA